MTTTIQDLFDPNNPSILVPRIKKNFDKTLSRKMEKKENIRRTRNRRRMKRIRLEKYSSCTTLKAFQFSTDAFLFHLSFFGKFLRQVVALLKNSSSSAPLLTSHALKLENFSPERLTRLILMIPTR